ncbi:MAG: flagellar basal body P-ring protein FlgI [Phycisphaerae bacterium]|nr:flagellar basal body P-ring protein FlgI [Phycisphaerae bacterium]
MDFNNLKKLSYLLIPTLFFLSLTGCHKPIASNNDDIEKPEVINGTIGSLAKIFQSGILEVRGFGIVAGLNGTGSSECPDDLRKNLVSQIKVEMRSLEGVSPQAFINSRNTAVVEIRGKIPPVASKGDVFDLRVAPLASTQTTSLKGGRLFPTMLVEYEQFIDFSRHLTPIAIASGPIFINKLADRNPDSIGDYIISGGRAIEGIRPAMLLSRPNFYTASLIRDLIDEKFGTGTADAKSKGEIFLKIPDKYRHQKQKFLAMVRLLYISSDPVLQQKRVDSLIKDLAENKNKLTPEIALEVMGNSVINKIAPLLTHPDEAVRFHTARCMLNIGDDRALKTLKKIIEDKNSPYRIEAIKAVGQGAMKNDAVAILSKVLNSEDIDISMAVYEEMRKLRDFSVDRYVVAGDFYLDMVMYNGENRIYVSRKGTPKIVIFGQQLECAKNLFVQSDDKDITINARRGDKVVSMWRKNPKKNGVIGPLKSTFTVKDIIRTLGELPAVSIKDRKRPGLAIPYYEICTLLEKMCKTGAIDAKFIAGDLPVSANIGPAGLPKNTPRSNGRPVRDTETYRSEDKLYNSKELNKLLEQQTPKKESNLKNPDEWRDLIKKTPDEESNLENSEEWRNLLE